MIRAERLSVHFKRFRGAPIKALDDVSLDIREGDYFALLGENGAGKSTAMHSFLGLLKPTSGGVTIFDRPVKRGDPLFARVGYIPEEPLYPGYLTVREAVDYYASLFPVAISPAERRLILERLGLGGFLDLPISKCSKGMKQKVGIAQALVNRPALLLLDEPMRGLDPVGVRDFRDILAELHRTGATIVMNSHILAEVEGVATRVGILKKGKLILDGSVEELTRTEADFYVVEYEGGDLDSQPYLTGIEAMGDGRRARLLNADLGRFMARLEESGGRLHSCVRQKRTLEESFLQIVQGAEANESAAI